MYGRWWAVPGYVCEIRLFGGSAKLYIKSDFSGL